MLVGDAEEAGPGDDAHAAASRPTMARTQATAPMHEASAMPAPKRAPVDWP